MVGVHLPNLLLADLLVVVLVQPADQDLRLLLIKLVGLAQEHHVLVYEVHYLILIQVA